MNTNRLFMWNKAALLLLALCISTALFTSCKNEVDIETGDPYFFIEGEPTGLSVGVKGTTSKVSYVVRSNRPWKIVPDHEVDWARAFPDEGEDDGIFEIIVNENMTFDLRTVNFSFVVDGEEQSLLYRIDQEKNVPFIEIIDAEKGIGIPAVGGEVTISLNTNVDWEYTISNESWLTELEKTATQLKLTAGRNFDRKRSVTLTVTSPSIPELSEDLVLTQSSGSVILEEDFSWLNYGNVIPYEYSGEKRFDSWTDEEKNKGWESTPSEFSSNQQLVYARPGFVKLGKTNYGGDLISPKLDLESTSNVKVTFKAAAYISAGGNIDDKVLNISVLGAGEASISELIIDNIPNSRAEDEAGVVNDIWDPERAYSFTITGATSQTQIRFLGGAFDLRGIGQGKNRIFLDDIKVEIINN
ncbi:MAG: BACON domain-containing carbohydrate-binding protein [Bacteroidales bacterium]|nr:BACON domain-containing carbohydrate-binding protein [Bacteroidales bacterium]MDD3550131.1 BACON domain-containing carbohydrate-binding protein [Bacteroidales bacterium]MDD5620809.1 BACON domain-containing carbohydrate-binding protein [Proteiniphilum sp.]